LTSMANARKLRSGLVPMEIAMKRVSAGVALAMFGLAPMMSAACEYSDSAASASPPDQVGLAAAPAASKVPAPAVAKVLAPNAVKQTAAKTKTVARDQKVATGNTN